MSSGRFTHVDIPSDDMERAKRFYGGLFGWQIGSVEGFPDYEMFRTGQEGVGGGIGVRDKTAPHDIRLYVTVDSIDEAIARLPDLGGSVVVAKTEIPGMGAYAAIKDSEGNQIGIWEEQAG